VGKLRRTLGLPLCLALILGIHSIGSAQTSTFEDLGVPVRKAGLRAAIVGPDARGENRLLYFSFNQAGAPLFLFCVDPDTHQTKQYVAPQGPGAWGLIAGPDHKIYLGTWDGALILRFDPARSDRGIEVVGRPAPSESYIWNYAVGRDGKLYGCTYPGAKLVSYDPGSGKMEDLGRMDPTEMYARSVAAAGDGKIYVGIGYARANVVAYDPATRSHKAILPEQYRKTGAAEVFAAANGKVYARVGNQLFRCENEQAVLAGPGENPAHVPQTLADGWILSRADDSRYTLSDPKTGKERGYEFTYEGAGSEVFVVGAGPDGRSYGSSILPLELFVYDPATGKSEDLGNPTPVTGEIYSMVALGDNLYVCAYPGSWLSVYDPRKPFKYGTARDSNPRGIGHVGDGHLRPRAMIVGPGKRLYIGSLPPYGELGGALGIYDAASDKFVENYRNIIPKQSVVSLAWEQRSGLVFGGSSIAGGGGSTPTEKEAHFFAFDPVARKKTLDIVPVAGDTVIVAMAAAEGKVFAVSRPSNALFVYDPTSHEIVHREKIPFGAQLEISLACFRGKLYGLAGRAVYCLDPKTYAVQKVAAYDSRVSCGFAVNDTGIYFGSGTHLIRYRW